MKCVFAGSFNPFTIGHQNIVDKCLQLFDEVVIAFCINPEKDRINEREFCSELRGVAEVYRDDPRVRIKTWRGLLIDLLKEEGTNICVRGVRNSLDFEYELQNYYMNKSLDSNIIEVFIPCDQNMSHISSTFVRTLKTFGRDYNEYLPTKRDN